MAISEGVVASEVRRFAEHPGFPKESDGVAALLLAFGEACSSDGMVREVADHLMRTLKFAPVPANVHRAAEQLAQAKRYTSEAPSIYDAPGEYGGNLAADLTPEKEAWCWARVERPGGDSFAHGVLTAFYRLNPHRRPDKPLPPPAKQQQTQTTRRRPPRASAEIRPAQTPEEFKQRIADIAKTKGLRK